MPIIVTHGWPGSIYEMHKIIPLLTDPASHGGDPADSFDVVVPSMPGYGFSAQTRERGMNTRRIAELWDKLMADELGYSRYAAQGGDWGAGVTARLGFHHSDHVLGIHTTSVTQAIPLPGRESARAQYARAAGAGDRHATGRLPARFRVHVFRTKNWR